MKRVRVFSTLFLVVVMIATCIAGCAEAPQSTPSAPLLSSSQPVSIPSVSGPPSASVSEPEPDPPFTATLGEEFFALLARRLLDMPLRSYLDDSAPDGVRHTSDFASPQELQEYYLNPDNLLWAVWLVIDMERYATESQQPTPFNLEQYRHTEDSIMPPSDTFVANNISVFKTYAFPVDTISEAFASWLSIEENDALRPLFEDIEDKSSMELYYDRGNDILFFQPIGSFGQGDEVSRGSIELSYLPDGVVSATIELAYGFPSEETHSYGTACITVRQFRDGRISLISASGFDA